MEDKELNLHSTIGIQSNFSNSFAAGYKDCLAVHPSGKFFFYCLGQIVVIREFDSNVSHFLRVSFD